MPTCGNCKNHHPSVADVRSCYTNTPTQPTSVTRARHSLVQAGLDATAQRQRLTNRTGTRPNLAAAMQAHDETRRKRTRKTVNPSNLYDGPNREVGENSKCLRCAGTGMFITGMENNVPVGPGGPCFRCEGKGRQTDCGPVAHGERAVAIALDDRTTEACCDRVRNDLYDRFGIRVSAF